MELLTEIRRLGLRCVIVSNSRCAVLPSTRGDFADLGIARCIDEIVTSLDVGFRKPHRAIFDAAIRAAACDPTSCVLIGNSDVKDIEPAVVMGMRVIRVAIEEPLPHSTAALADSLPSVSRILQGRAVAHDVGAPPAGRA